MAVGSPQNIFSIFSQAAPRAFHQPADKKRDLIERQWLISENEVGQALKENKRKLYTSQIPIASMVGLGVYAFLMGNNPNRKTVQNLQSLLSSQAYVAQEVTRLEQTALASEIKMPAPLKTALAQLKTTLYKGGSPYYTKKYMDDVRQAASNWQNISILENLMETYQGSVKRVLSDRKGLQKLATEPIILSKLRLSKKSSEVLVASNREEFLQKLFEQGLSDVNRASFQLVFQKLLNANQRMARLAAGITSVVLVGYFVMVNKARASKIYERGF